MNAAYHYSAYTNAKANTTASRSKQVIMLYEGVIKFVQQAKTAIAAGEIEARFHALSKASEIMFGLQNGLDFKQGGQLAYVLYQFYADINYSINQVQKNNNVALCDDIIHQLKTMMDSWKDVEQELDGPQLSAAEGTTMPATSGTAESTAQHNQDDQNGSGVSYSA